LCVAVLVGVFGASQASAAPPDFSGVWVPDVKDQKRQEVEITPDRHVRCPGGSDEFGDTDP